MLDSQSLEKYRSHASRYDIVSRTIKKLNEKKEAADQEVARITEEYRKKIDEVMGTGFTRAIRAIAPVDFERETRVIELQEEQSEKIDKVLKSVDVSDPSAISDEELSSMLEEPGVLEEVEKAIEELKRNLEQQKRFNLVGHRWSSTRSDFLEALRRGEYIVEKDFRSTSDGDAVASHSLKLGAKRKKGDIRGLSLSGKNISLSTVEQLKEIDEDLLTLGQALDDFEPYAEQHMFILDIKDALVVDVLLNILKSRKDGKNLSKRLIIASNSAVVIHKLLSQKDFEFGGFNMEGNPVTGNPLSFATLSEGSTPSLMTKLKKARLRSAYRASVEKPSIMSPRQVVSPGSEAGEGNEVNEILAIEGDSRETVANVFISLPRRFLQRLSQSNGSLELSRPLIKSNLIAAVSPEKAQKSLTREIGQAGQHGLKAMFVTFGERALKGTKGFDAENQVRRILKASEDSGVGVIIYTEDPIDISKKLSQDPQHPQEPQEK